MRVRLREGEEAEFRAIRAALLQLSPQAAPELNWTMSRRDPATLTGGKSQGGAWVFQAESARLGLGVSTVGRGRWRAGVILQAQRWEPTRCLRV